MNVLVECEYVWLLWYWGEEGGCDLGSVCKRRQWTMEAVLVSVG